jgi:FtsZ-interacting cell division protein YlmF
MTTDSTTTDMTDMTDDTADRPVPERPGLAARGTQDYEYIADPEADAEEPGQPGAETGDRDDERPGRREARYRRERNEARAQVKALEQRVENLVAREVARIASDTLEDGFDLVVFMPGDYSDAVDEHGAVDAEKVTEYARQLVQWKPGLARGARVPTPSFGQGRRAAVDQGDRATWGSVLRGRP